MTEQKPPGTSWESWIEQQIREAQEAGAFDQLPGAGKPRGLIPRKAKVAQTMRAPQVEQTRFRSHLVRVDEVL